MSQFDVQQFWHNIGDLELHKQQDAVDSLQPDEKERLYINGFDLPINSQYALNLTTNELLTRPYKNYNLLPQVQNADEFTQSAINQFQTKWNPIQEYINLKVEKHAQDAKKGNKPKRSRTGKNDMDTENIIYPRQNDENDDDEEDDDGDDDEETKHTDFINKVETSNDINNNNNGTFAQDVEHLADNDISPPTVVVPNPLNLPLSPGEIPLPTQPKKFF